MASTQDGGRGNRGLYTKGRAKTGGRIKGTPNRITVDLKEMILGALNAKGGQAYLEKCADENPVAFMSLLGRILPMESPGKAFVVAKGSVNLTVSFVKPVARSDEPPPSRLIDASVIDITPETTEPAE